MPNSCLPILGQFLRLIKEKKKKNGKKYATKPFYIINNFLLIWSKILSRVKNITKKFMELLFQKKKNTN